MAAPLPQLPRSQQRPRNLRRPNLGLVLNKNAYEMDPRALIDTNNARIKNGEIDSRNMGWEPFPENIGEGLQYNLDSKQVLFIQNFETRAGTTISMFANQTDLFYHDVSGPTLKYLTPIYITGTVDNPVSNQAIVGTGTAWATARLTAPVTGGFGDNVRPGDFIHFGATNQILPTATWHEIDTVVDNTHLTLLTDPGLLGGATAYTIRQTFTGTNLDRWFGETFPKAQTTIDIDGTPATNRDEDTVYLTNGLEMVGWDGNNLTAWWFFPGFVARKLRYHRQIMLASFIDEAGERKSQAIKTSRLNFPEDFTTEEATEFVSANGTSDIETLEPLGDSVIAYYERDIEVVTFVGPPLFWLIRSAVPGIGILSPTAIADFGDYHEILSHDRAYRFDGVSITEVMPQVMREVLRKQAPNRERRTYVHIDDENGEAIWSIPLSTDGTATDSPPVTAYSQHYLEASSDNLPPPMMQRDFPFTAAGRFIRDTGALRFSDFATRDDDDFSKVDFAWNDRALQAAFPFSIGGDGNGDIWILSTKSTKGVPASPFTAVVDSFVEFPFFAWGDGDLNGLLHWVMPYCDALGTAYNLLVTVTATDRYDDQGPKLRSSSTFDLSHGIDARIAGTAIPDRRLPFRIAGRYGNIRFSNDTDVAGSFFTCGGYRVQLSPMGDR